MSEYNIQMNKYDALNADYDQLYPQPMKHASTHASGGTDPITPGDIGAYSKNETDTLLKKKADASSVYTKEESISAATRTALSLAETATPDDALAEIARQLSESGSVKLVKLWENASPTSAFSATTITLDMTGYEFFIVKFGITTGHPEEEVFSPIVSKCSDHSIEVVTGAWNDVSSYRRRTFQTRDNKLICADGYEGNTLNNNQIIPLVVYGLKGVTV